VSAALKERLGVRFTFLSDQKGVLLDRLAIRHRGGHEGADVAYPAAILVDREGIVRWTFQPDTFRERAHPDRVFDAIAKLDSSGTPG
jgi:peroxiredoxin